MAIEAEAERRGWTLITILEDAGVSAKSTKGRKGLEAAITLIEAGGADALVASKVDRVARSLLDFCSIVDRAKRNRWSLICLDAGFDQTTPQGRAMVQMLGVFAELERELISQRTRDGLAAKKAAGGRLGRPVNTPERVVERIRRQRASGASLGAIAAGLNDDAIPTAQSGAQWHASTVRAVLARTG
jgi:DNA invertase Pin-like site-specific DNA recombinase